MYSDTSVPVLVEVCLKRHELEMMLQYRQVAFPVVCPVRVIIPPLLQNTCLSRASHPFDFLLSLFIAARTHSAGRSLTVLWDNLVMLDRLYSKNRLVSFHHLSSHLKLRLSFLRRRGCAQQRQHINVLSEESEERTYHCVGR